ncbi:leishmanolysin family protein, putative, partial [Ichthyophthirius multifiliis]
QPNNIRIIYDYTPIMQDNLLDQQYKDLIQVSCELAKMFIQNLLKVKRRIAPLSSVETECIDIPMSSMISSPNTVQNADLFLIVSTENDRQQTRIANAGACDFDDRPIIGRIQFNQASLDLNDLDNMFTLYYKVAIHEIIHVLGFSDYLYPLWINPITKQSYGFNYRRDVIQYQDIFGKERVLIISNNVKKVFQRHFGCTEIKGIAQEESSNSHFERIYISTDLMNASVDSKMGGLTQFTIALLKDTGFYEDVNENMATYSFWGYNKGCTFIKEACKSQYQYREFSQDLSKYYYNCDVNGDGKGSIFNSTFTDGCSFIKPIYTQFCTMFDKYQPNQISGEIYSYNSKCVNSNYGFDTIWNPYISVYGDIRCFQTNCKDDETLEIITSNKEVYVCKYPLQIITLTGDLKGTIQCPENFKYYCSYRSYCKQDCSRKGYCLNNVCNCLPGFGGSYCQIQLSEGQVLYNHQIQITCPKGTFKNPNNECLSTCPRGYFGDQQTQECKNCSSKCSQCTGPEQNACTNCNMDYILINNQCIESSPLCLNNCRICSDTICYSCKLGYYLNKNNQCVKCSNNCYKCADKIGFCIQCEPQYQLYNQNCYSINEFSPNCISYDLQDKSKCLKCFDQYYLGEDALCKQCKDGYYFDIINQKCIQCDSQCKTCINQASSCTSCETDDYFFSIEKKQCISISSNQVILENSKCHFSCNQCFGEKYYQCITCKGNREAYQYFLGMRSCECNYMGKSSDIGTEMCIYNESGHQMLYLCYICVFLMVIQQLYFVFLKKQSPAYLIIVVEFAQKISYFQFINQYTILHLDQFFNIFQYSNLINYANYLVPLDNKTIFQNQKAFLNGKTPYFILNIIVLLLLLVIFYLTMLYLVKILKKIKEVDYKYYIVLINFFIIQEVTFNAILQLQTADYDVFAALNCVFAFSMVGFIIFQSFKIMKENVGPFGISKVASQPEIPVQLENQQKLELQVVNNIGNNEQTQLGIKDYNSNQIQSHAINSQQIVNKIQAKEELKSIKINKFEIYSLLFIYKIAISMIFGFIHFQVLVQLIIFIVFQILTCVFVGLKIQFIERNHKLYFIEKQIQSIVIAGAYMCNILLEGKNYIFQIVITAFILGVLFFDVFWKFICDFINITIDIVRCIKNKETNMSVKQRVQQNFLNIDAQSRQQIENNKTYGHSDKNHNNSIQTGINSPGLNANNIQQYNDELLSKKKLYSNHSS